MTLPIATVVGASQVLLVRQIPAPSKKSTWMGRCLELLGVRKTDSNPSVGRTIVVARLIPTAPVVARPPRGSLFTPSPERAREAYLSARERVLQRLDIERARIAGQQPQKSDNSKPKSVAVACDKQSDDPADDPTPPPSAPPA